MGMIISASRRTDIPAFYAEWFMNRVRAGFCDVPNPVNPNQVGRVSLRPEDVDAVVFWTRHPGPLFEHFDELDCRGFRYYFQFTLLGYPKMLAPASPPGNKSVEVFRILSDRIGPKRIVWRYDPIILSNLTPESWHLENFRDFTATLGGFTHRVVISLLDRYPFIEKRLRRLEEQGLKFSPPGEGAVNGLIKEMTRIAVGAGMDIFGCAEGGRLERLGVPPGKCIDDELIERVFKMRVAGRKDPGQRPACRCVVSRDIGIYDTCPMGCVYCYATRDTVQARRNHRSHNPDSPSLAAPRLNSRITSGCDSRERRDRR